MYRYLGIARNVRELLKLLEETDASATLTIEGLVECGSFVEVWVSEAGDDVMLK